jgi:hypothetical protein
MRKLIASPSPMTSPYISAGFLCSLLHYPVRRSRLQPSDWMIEAPKTDSSSPPIQRSRFWEGRMKGTVVSNVTPTENYGPLVLACYLIAICMLASAEMLTITLPSSYGHDATRPDLIPWFVKLHGKAGPCSAGCDALHLWDVDWTTQTRKKALAGSCCPRPPASAIHNAAWIASWLHSSQ